MGKYEELVFEFPREYNELISEGDDPSCIMSPQAYFRGATQLPGSVMNVGYQIFVKPFFIDRITHRHDVEEFIIFMGGCFPNLFDFDADIDFTIGKIGVDAQVFHIDRPTIVRIPAGVYHCPLNFIRVDKPVFFQAALMQDMFSSIFDLDDGGQTELRYNGPLPCKNDPKKKCDCCRSCIEGNSKWSGPERNVKG